MSESSKFCSVTRHTANEQPAEGRITYRFHPRCGKTVQIRRRLERGGVAFVVVHQPDGSFACLPAWMLEPTAARFEIGAAPHFSVDILRDLRREIDALLGCLQCESKPKEADDDASTPRSNEPVRRKAATPRAAAKAEGRTGRGRERATAGNRGGTRKANKTSNNGGRS